MYFVPTCIIVPKKGATSDGILNTTDSKALKIVNSENNPRTIESYLQCTLPKFFVILLDDMENAGNDRS